MSETNSGSALGLVASGPFISDWAALPETHVQPSSDGTNWHWASTATAEIYDPSTNIWTATGNLNSDRAYHAAVLLPTGKVLIVGGYHCDLAGNIAWPNTTELFDPSTGTFSVMDTLDYGLSSPQLALMSDGSVFVAGQVQAPMNPPTPQTQAKSKTSSMLARPRAGDVLNNLSLLVGSSLFGTTAPCPTLVFLKFTSDHSVLKASQDNNDWGDSSASVYKPEWFYSKSSMSSISQTMGTTLGLTAQVYLGSSVGTQYVLTGTGSHGYSSFQKTITANGKIQNVSLTANASLPNAVGILSETIKWTITSAGQTTNVGTTGPFKVYVTFNTPIDTVDAHGTRKGCDITENRMRWCCQTASGESTIDGIANKLYVTLGNTPPVFGYLGQNADPITSTPPYLWSLLTDSTKVADCIRLAHLMQMQALILGVPASRGFVYASDILPNPPTSCYTDWDADNADIQYRTRTCSTHGQEELWFYAPYPSINRWEGVCSIAGTFYGVKEVETQFPFDMIKKFIITGNFSGPDGPLDGDHFQVWRYRDEFKKLQDCTVDHYPQPLP